MFGRFAGVLVCQRVDDLVRKLVAHGLGDGVHEVEEGTCLGTLGLRERGAVFAGAVVLVVILGDAEDLAVGVAAHRRSDLVDDDLQDFRVGQAWLGVFQNPFATDERIVFGVFRTIFLWGNKIFEGMDEAVVADIAAPLRVVAVAIVAVVEVPHGELGGTAFGIVGLAVFQGWDVGAVEFRKVNGPFVGNHFAVLGEPPAAQLLLKKVIDRIEDTTLPADQR